MIKWIITFKNGKQLVSTISEEVKIEFLEKKMGIESEGIFTYKTEKGELFDINLDEVMSCVFYDNVMVDNTHKIYIVHKTMHGGKDTTHLVTYNMLGNVDIDARILKNEYTKKEYLVKAQTKEDQSIYVFIDASHMMYVQEGNNE